MLGADGFPTEANYAEGVGVAKNYTVSTTAQDYSGKHVKLTLSGSDSGKDMGAVTAESLWITSSAKTRFRFTNATFQNVKALFLSGVNAWNNSEADITFPETLTTLTLGAGGSNSDGSNNYKNALFRIGKTLKVKGRTTVPAGQVVKVAPNSNDDSAFTLDGGLSGTGTLRIGGGHDGKPLTCVITGGDFTGTLGLYNDASATSNGTFTLNGANLCPVLDMWNVKNGAITVNVSQAMGLNDGSQLTAGRLNITGIPGTEKAAFTLANGATVTVGEGLTLNLPAAAKPEGATPTTYKLFTVPEGAKVEGTLQMSKILFEGTALTGGVALLRADGTLTLWAGDTLTVAEDTRLSLDGAFAAGGSDPILLSGGEAVLTQANTATQTLKVTAGATLTLSGETAAWAGPIVFEGGAALALVDGATLPSATLPEEGSVSLEVREGGTLTLGSDRLAELARYTLTVAEGGTVCLRLTSAEYLAGTFTLPEALRGSAERFALQDPAGNTLKANQAEGTFAFTTETLSFALPTGWELETPTFAKKIAANATQATQGLVEDITLRQPLNDREAIVANATGAVDKAVVFGGYPYGSDEKTLTQDVWLKVSGGTFRQIVGGNDMQNYGGKPRHLSGDTVVNISGGSVDYAYSCNLFDGKASTITGRHALVIDGDAVLKGSAAASSAIHGSGVTYNNATLNLTIRNLQNDNSASDGDGVLPGWDGGSNIKAGFLVGGGMSTRSNAPHKVNGNTSVCVELPEGTAGVFSKTLIGGNYTTQGSGTLTVSGTSTVRVSAPAGVTFNKDIVGGSHATGSATMTTGASEVTLTGGSYTGTITAGSLGTKATTTGNATLTLDGANVSAATLNPGNVNGTATLVLKTAAAPKTLGAFDVITSATPEAVLTLPAANADLSGTAGTFTLDASAIDTLTVSSKATLTFTALPTAGLAVAFPSGENASTFTCAAPEGTTVEGLAFTVNGVEATGAVDGTTLTVKPAIEGPFTATVTGDAAWGDLQWLNAKDEAAPTFAEALALGATLKATASAAITLDGDIAGTETLAIEVTDGAALTFNGTGKLNSPIALTGAMTLAASTYAANVTLANATSALTLDLGKGSGKHANMLGAIAGPGDLRIHATGGNWDAGAGSGNTLFASRLNIPSSFTGKIYLGDGKQKIRCAPKTFADKLNVTIVLGKGTTFRQTDTWGNGSYPCYLPLQVSSGAHLQDGGWGTEGCGVVRTGYTVNFRSPVSGVSKEGESPALINAYAGTGTVNFECAVSGDGIATGSWGSGEGKAMTYNLNKAENDFRQLLIRNMKLSTTSQVATTVNAVAGGLGGSAITFGTENGQANKSTLNVNGNNTVASVTATNGGNIALAAGVTLTVEGAADLSGLTALKVKLADNATLPFTALTANALTLSATKVTVVNAAGEAVTGVRAVITDTKLVVQALPVPAEGHGLTGETLLAVQTVAAEAGFADGFAVEALTSAGKTAGAAADVLACFTGLPMEAVKDEAGERVIIRCDFGIDVLRAEGENTFLARASLREGAFAEGATVSLMPTSAEGVTVEEVEAPAGEATAEGSKWFRVRTTGAEVLRLKVHVSSSATEG